jgi:hypothetical protein
MNARRRRFAPARAAAPAREAARRIAEGLAQEVTPDGRVLVATTGGEALLCRVPMHVSLPWLRAALARAPVPAEVTVGEGDAPPSLWSLFPGPEHEGVVPETIEIAASERIDLVCGASKIALAGKEVRVRSRDVAVTGSRVTRVRGGTVKVN